MSAVAKVTFCSPVPPLWCIQVSWNIFESIIVAISVMELGLANVRGLSSLVSVTSSSCTLVLLCLHACPLTWLTVSSPHLSLSVLNCLLTCVAHFCAVALLQAGSMVAWVPCVPQGHAEIFFSSAHHLLWIRHSRLPTVSQELPRFSV